MFDFEAIGDPSIFNVIRKEPKLEEIEAPHTLGGAVIHT